MRPLGEAGFQPEGSGVDVGALGAEEGAAQRATPWGASSLRGPPPYCSGVGLGSQKASL